MDSPWYKLVTVTVGAPLSRPLLFDGETGTACKQTHQAAERSKGTGLLLFPEES